jgi:outer membrane protein assembly factor BamB
MATIELRPLAPSSTTTLPPGSVDTTEPSDDVLSALLLGPAPTPSARRELPPLPDLVAALADLGAGLRRKALLPLGGRPAELALVRRGDAALVWYYETGSVPEVQVRERVVPLSGALAACAAAARRAAAAQRSGAARDAHARLALVAERAIATLRRDDTPVEPVVVQSGCIDDPGEELPLAFGFEARLTPCGEGPSEGSARADVQATLFEGRLWAWSRGRRIALGRGAIFLLAQRLLTGARAVVEAWEAGRAVHVRLRSGGFGVAYRMDRCGTVALTLGSEEEGTITVPALDVPSAVEPVLRLGGDLVRALTGADRGQLRNLRVTALRDEVRSLRRALRARTRVDGIVNTDPDRLRLASGAASLAGAGAPSNPAHDDRDEWDSGARRRGGRLAAPAGRLRYAERWRTEIEGLDAASTFLCGDRLVVAGPRRVTAIGRDDGEVLWTRRAARAASMMVGTTLLRLSAEGTVELWDVAEGEVTARTAIAPRTGGPPVGTFVGGGSLPPMAVVSEGTSRLAAIDLRTGELRWRHRARAGAFRFRRVGRLLLVVGGDGALTALDVGTGEVAWRFSDQTRFTLAPAVGRDVVVAASGDASAVAGTLYGVDLWSGLLRWRRELDAAPLAAPLAIEGQALLPVAGAPRGALAAFDLADGALAWSAPDPGLGRGGAALPIDQTLIVNVPGGRVSALDLADGRIEWQRDLANPATDDVPRRLEPVLRGGALFVPAAQVHVLRPHDGASLGPAVPCELIPDVLRVDERGWLFVAEESGHLRGYAPGPVLSLVR